MNDEIQKQILEILGQVPYMTFFSILEQIRGDGHSITPTELSNALARMMHDGLIERNLYRGPNGAQHHYARTKPKAPADTDQQPASEQPAPAVEKKSPGRPKSSGQPSLKEMVLAMLDQGEQTMNMFAAAHPDYSRVTIRNHLDKFIAAGKVVRERRGTHGYFYRMNTEPVSPKKKPREAAPQAANKEKLVRVALVPSANASNTYHLGIGRAAGPLPDGTLHVWVELSELGIELRDNI